MTREPSHSNNGLEAGLILLCPRPRIKSSISYQALGGYYRPEAIMLLRRFYLIQNSNGEANIAAAAWVIDDRVPVW